MADIFNRFWFGAAVMLIPIVYLYFNGNIHVYNKLICIW